MYDPTKKQAHIHRRHVFASNSTRLLSFTEEIFILGITGNNAFSKHDIYVHVIIWFSNIFTVSYRRFLILI
jgi:hypothetical protein